MKLKETKEQKDILKYFNKNSTENTKILAYAGAGKTYILRRIAENLKNKKILNLSFNKKIARESSHVFPSNTECRTFHSLAYRSLGNVKFTDGLKSFTLHLAKGGYEIKYHERWLAYEMIRKFCQTDDLEISEKHIYTSKNLERFKFDQLKKSAPAVANGARNFWNAYMKNGSIPITHECYLKKFVLSNKIPKLDKYDIIMVDEAQDANPAMISLLKKIEKTKQVIIVGDPFQQIYSFTGAKNALDLFDYKEFRLTKSFRWGNKIAGFSNEILKYTKTFNKDYPVRGMENKNNVIIFNPKEDDMCDEPDAIICRTNKGCFNEATSLYKQNISYNFSGAKTLYKTFQKLKNKKFRRTKMKVCGCKTWEELVDNVITGNIELSYKWMILAMENDQTAEIERFLTNSTSLGVYISTAHKVKGMEWDEVKLSNDYINPKNCSEEEFRIFYVALTRVKKTLYVPLSKQDISEKLLTIDRGVKKGEVKRKIKKIEGEILRNVAKFESMPSNKRNISPKKFYKTIEQKKDRVEKLNVLYENIKNSEIKHKIREQSQQLKKVVEYSDKNK